MTDFEKAQRLVGEYEKNENLALLEDARDILDDLIAEKESVNAKNLKEKIQGLILQDLRNIFLKYNLKDFKVIHKRKEKDIWEPHKSVMTVTDSQRFTTLLRLLGID